MKMQPLLYWAYGQIQGHYEKKKPETHNKTNSIV